MEQQPQGFVYDVQLLGRIGQKDEAVREGDALFWHEGDGLFLQEGGTIGQDS